MPEEGYVYPRGFASKFNVARSVFQLIPSGAWTIIEWNAEFFDLLDEMLIIAPWTFTPKQAGYYHLNVLTRLNDLTIPSQVMLYFFLNGFADIAGSTGETTNVNEDITLNISGLPYLTPTDVIDVRIFHNNGIARSLQGNVNENRFIGHRIG